MSQYKVSFIPVDKDVVVNMYLAQGYKLVKLEETSATFEKPETGPNEDTQLPTILLD